ncbi:MAG: DEAD/DEAH box helicase, partial [Elainellaceae cyanobacterium]
IIAPSLDEVQPRGCPLEPDEAYRFIKSVTWQLQDSGFGVILPPSLSNPDGWASRLGLAVRAQTPRRKKNQSLSLQSLLNFRWELTIGSHRISKEDFDRLIAQKSPLVEIDGEWVELRPQDIKAAQEFFGTRKDQVALSLEDALRISSGDSKTVEKLPVVDFEASGALNTLLETLTTGDEAIETIPTPEGFRGTLRPYQQRGVSWLSFLGRWGLGACLADDMGLGKTIQLIALLLHLQENDALDAPTLLVCPTSVIGNWEREVRRFGPSLKVMVHHGDRAQGKAFVKAANAVDIVITSYTLAYRDQKSLEKVSWQGLVLDEAQNIKNPEARQSQAVRQLESQFRIALTGTPLENRLSELWSIIDFLNPGYLGPRNFFQRRFAVPIERYGDSASLHALRSLVQPFILRRLKTDRTIIQDLPDKQEMTVFCGLSDTQADLYQSLVDQSMREIEAAEGIQRHGQILALLTKLKQVCDHPALLKTEEDGNGKSSGSKASRATAKADSPLAVSSAEFPTLSGKLQRLEAMLEEVLAEGDRALLFTQFAQWGKLLKSFLEHRFGQEVLFLYGSTSRQAREVMVDRFQNDPQGPRLFILSLKAGGTGLNLTRANHVFHVDRWWNPAVENQATDRAFRIGQTQNVQVHKFVCSGTLEERIHEISESKKALSEQVVGTGETWLGEFDTQQLRNLLLLDRSAIVDQEPALP